MRKLMHALWLVALMMAGSVWSAETGYVHAVSGDVTITRVGKAAAKAKLGDLFEEGAQFVTGTDGKATLKFADGQVIALAPRTQFAVTSYVYTPAQPGDNNILFSLVRGGARFVTGLIGQSNPAKFAMRTPTLTAGVRGTDGTIIVADDGSTVVSVTDGTVTITSSTGTVVITKGNFAFYPTGSSSPSATGPVSSLPADAVALIAIAAGLQSTELPPPSPVDVIQAAKDVVDAAGPQSGAGSPGPTPTPGPGGGGGGGRGVSPS
jgi:hypothetical protein